MRYNEFLEFIFKYYNQINSTKCNNNISELNVTIKNSKGK